MLDLVPFAGSRWVVTDRDRYPDLIRHLLQVEFLCAKSISVTAPSIRTDEQSSRRRIALSPVQFPPSPDAFHRQPGRVVGYAHIDHSPILPGVVDPIGKRLTLGQAGEIFGVHLPRLSLSGATCAPHS
jgi:hypothetical protein